MSDRMLDKIDTVLVEGAARNWGRLKHGLSQ